MVNAALRVVLCALVGLFSGAIIGGLFASDPTGPLVPVLTLVVALVIGAGLFRSDWLRDDTA